MSNEIRVHSKWCYTLDCEDYAVVNIFVDKNQNTIVCAHSLDTGYYGEWYLQAFYTDFKFVSEESL